MTTIKYKELIAFHPGAYVKDLIEDLEMNQHELSKRLGITSKTVSKFINGDAPLSNELASRLSIVFGTSIELWLNLNNNYIKKQVEIEQKKSEDKQKEILDCMNYNFWVKLGLLENTRKYSEKIKELTGFLKIASLTTLKEKDFLVQFRSAVLNLNDKNIINANAWVQTAINIGIEKKVPKYDARKLENSLDRLRNLTILESKDFYPQINEILVECGVTFVVLPYMKNCAINGAVKWIGKEKVILSMNDRRKSIDTFWFSFFHEIKHVLQHKITKLISDGNIENLNINDKMLLLEKEADSFSQDLLIPPLKYLEFTNNHRFNANNVIQFSNLININPGVVVGRLQKDNYVLYSNVELNKLKSFCTVVR